MPVSLVKPSSTSCGMYSDQPNRFTSVACSPAAPQSTARAETSDFSTFMMVGLDYVGAELARSLGKISTRGFFEILREKHKGHGRDDEDGRERVQHRVQPDLREAVDPDGQRRPLRVVGEPRDDQLV